MTSLIKNQILKHLSKFAKNLSPDQMKLSTLKGEGELRNLELNEIVMTDLLELPNWLKISKITCNFASVRITWTKLKSCPIQISLDEVNVEVETCEELRSFNSDISFNGSPLATYMSSGYYGFVDKVIDSVSVSVNLVVLTLKSKVFSARIEVSRISVQSRSPKWEMVDLRLTRLKDTDKGEVLIFKQLQWKTVRIEAKSICNESLTPLKLITNEAKCRITLKKKLSDCSILGCRLVLVMDEILWVFTDNQLKAAFHFADSISGLVKRATEDIRRVKGAKKLENLAQYDTVRNKCTQETINRKKKIATPIAILFGSYDVVETSYHFQCNKVDLHLCDEPGMQSRSCHPRLQSGGAFQVSMSRIHIDMYPYHLARADRSAWIYYQRDSPHYSWLKQSLTEFRSVLMEILLSNHSSTDQFKYCIPQSKTMKHSEPGSSPKSSFYVNQSPNVKRDVFDPISNQLDKLMSANLILRIYRLSMRCVSTLGEKVLPKDFITGDGLRFSLPDEMPLLHLEFTQFFYPGDMEFAIPPPKLYVFSNPIVLHVDPLTILWLSTFSMNLIASLKLLALETTEPPYIDIKLQSMMTRILYEEDRVPNPSIAQPSRPRSLQIQISKLVVANFRGSDTGNRADLGRTLEGFQATSFFYAKQNDYFPGVCDKFLQHATGCDDGKLSSDVKMCSESGVRRDLLWKEAKDIWNVSCDPFWIDFVLPSEKPQPFVDALPLTAWLWIRQPSEDVAVTDSAAYDIKVHAIIRIRKLINVQVDHFQLLFLLRMMEVFAELTAFMAFDLKQIDPKAEETGLVLSLMAPQVDVSCLMPVLPNLNCSTPPASVVSSVPYTILSSPDRKESVIPTNNAELCPSLIPVFTDMRLNESLKFGSADELNKLSVGLPNLNLSSEVSHRQFIGDNDNLSLRSHSSMDSDTFALMVDVKNMYSSDILGASNLNGSNSENCENKADLMMSSIISQRSDSSAIEVAIEAVEVANDLPLVQCENEESDWSKSSDAAVCLPTTVPCISDPKKISVMTLHLRALRFVHLSLNSRSTIKLQVSTVSVDELPLSTLEEFQAKFASNTKCWNENFSFLNTSPSSICLRFSTEALFIRPQEVENDFGDILGSSKYVCCAPEVKPLLELEAQNISLVLHQSTLVGIVDLVEDEITPEPMPMHILLENIFIRLIEDRIPFNVTSPGAVPIDLEIKKIAVLRNKLGVFSILSASEVSEFFGFGDLRKSYPIVSQSNILNGNGTSIRHSDDILTNKDSVVSIADQLRIKQEEINELNKHLNKARSELEQLHQLFENAKEQKIINNSTCV